MHEHVDTLHVLRKLCGNENAATSYRKVGATTQIVIDGAGEVILDSDGAEVTGHAAPDLVVRMSDDDAVRLMRGELTATRLITSGRVAARGPIFRSIGVIRSIGQLNVTGG